MSIADRLDERRPAGVRSVSDHIIQGEQRVTGDADVVLATILGSCVSACLQDPVAKIGGMNHFLLPGDLGDAEVGERLGVHAMELLINALLSAGAARRRLQAKVFGGANLNIGLADIGGANATFARQFLRREGITVVAECLGGRLGRRVQFWPVIGRARRSFLAASDQAVHALPRSAPAPVASATGALELF